MSICDTKLKAKPLPTCINFLTVGYVPAINSTVSVYVWDITTDNVRRFDTMTNGSGLVTVDVSEMEFMERHAYEIWVSNTTNYEDREMLTIDGQVADGVNVRFKRIVDEFNESEIFNTISITL